MKRITKNILICIIICGFVSLSLSIPLYFSGIRKGYHLAYGELEKPTFENWIFLQKENQSMNIAPSFGFGLNFSKDIENKSTNTTIMDTSLETVYVLNITATKGNLTGYGFAIIFNDAISLHYWTRITYYYETYYNISARMGRTVNRENYKEGIYYLTSYINFRGFDIAKIIRLEIFISDVIY